MKQYVERAPPVQFPNVQLLTPR